MIGNIGTLAAECSATMTIVIETSATTAPSIINTATASSDLADPAPGDNSARPSRPRSRTDRPRGQRHGSNRPFAREPAPLLHGDGHQHGPSPATGVQLTALARGRYVRLSDDSLGNILTPDNGRLVDTIGEAASQASATLTIVVTTIAPGSFDISATVDGAGRDDDSSNNRATFTTAVVPAADLAVRLVASRGQVTTGDRLTYTLTVTNKGPIVGHRVVLNERLPGQTIISMTTSQGGVSLGSGLVTARLGDLAVGASASVTIVVMPTIDGTGPAVATVNGMEVDPNTADNQAVANVQVIEPPGTFQFASPTVVVPENAGTATIVVRRPMAARAGSR